MQTCLTLPTRYYSISAIGWKGVANKTAAFTSQRQVRLKWRVLFFSSDSGWLALGGNDGTVKIWDTYQRKSLATINAYTGTVSALAFSADGDQLAGRLSCRAFG